MRTLLRKICFGINVYQGISPSLLATMSLSVNIKGKNQFQLIENMAKAGLISDKQEIQAFKVVDRQHFTKIKNPYENKPYSISNRQNMTDIFTHSVIINNLTKYWRNNLQILDIGTGHGYLSFLIAQILQNKMLHQYSISGIDIYPESINYCQQLQKKIGSYSQRLKFQCIGLDQYLQKVNDDSLDVIIGGYYFQQDLSQKLIKKLSKNGVGIWPTRSQSGQALYKLQKSKEKVYLIETMFSMPVVRSQVSKYFISEGDVQQQNYTSTSQTSNEMTVEQIKSIKKQMQQKLREQLKVLVQKYRKNGKVPNLKEMRQIPEINAKLIELQKLPKTKVKFQVK